MRIYPRKHPYVKFYDDKALTPINVARYMQHLL